MPTQKLKKKQQIKASNQQTKIGQVKQPVKQQYQKTRQQKAYPLLLKQRLRAQKQQLSAKKIQQADKHKFRMAKLRLIKNKLNSGKGSSIPMIVFLIFSLICGIIVGAWFLILKPILGLLNPLKFLNPLKWFKKKK